MVAVAQKITPELKAYIAEAIQEALNDPDAGLELRASFKKKLQASLNKKNQKMTSFEEIKRKYL